ncbi:MAG TPA: glycosyltransferase family 4 protein [Coleofasciculaceae cyanobacterium]
MTNSLQPCKLLHITTVPATLLFLRGQVGYMKLRGLEVHILSSPGEFLSQFLEHEQVTAHTVTMTRQITPLQDLWSVVQIWICLRQIRPQIVHAGTPKGGLLGMIAAWFAGSPIRIYQMRGLPLMTATGYKRQLLWWTEKIACLLAHQIICNSHSLQRVAISEGLCPATKIKVLVSGSSNGVDATARFNPARLPAATRQEIRQRYRIPADALVLGFVGRLVQDKGVIELAEAWKTLRQEFPDLHLLMVGRFEAHDPLPLWVEQLLKDDERIHLTGVELDTPPLYTAMDIFVLPSYVEGFANVNLESAAMQLPVVTTNAVGCIDSIQDGITGTLIPAQDVAALVEALRLYLKNPELRLQQGIAGRKRVLQEFRQEAIWEAMYQEYAQLLEKQGLSVPSMVV